MFLLKKLFLIIKKYRYLNLFIIIGFSSILFEIIIFNYLKNYINDNLLASIISLIFGISFAFYLNFSINFKIHKSKIYRAFTYFILISVCSKLFQEFFGQNFLVGKTSYELKRIITSSFFFIFAYFFHRKFSFQDYRRIGVALYLSKRINLKQIYSVIQNNSNFIHIDIVDKSFSKSKVVNDINVLKKIKKIWPNHQIEFHVMSKYPTKWVKQIINYSNKIYIHYEAKEDLDKLRKYITKKNKEFGIAVTLKTDPKKIKNLLKKSVAVLILGVDKPGFSGQNFNNKAFEYIDYFNKLNFRNKFRICVDGGVNKEIARALEVDDLVSNSSILGSKSPILEINDMRYSNF